MKMDACASSDNLKPAAVGDKDRRALIGPDSDAASMTDRSLDINDNPALLGESLHVRGDQPSTEVVKAKSNMKDHTTHQGREQKKRQSAPIKFVLSLRYKFKDNPARPPILLKEEFMPAHDDMVLWRDTVWVYMALDLTDPLHRLPALSRFAHKLLGDGWSGNNGYLAVGCGYIVCSLTCAGILIPEAQEPVITVVLRIQKPLRAQYVSWPGHV